MRHQTITIAGAVVLSLVANGVAFAAPDSAAPAAAATECLSAPKGDTPTGGHWYYRTDRVNKRKCWYLGDASAKAAKVTTATPSHSAKQKPVATAKSAPRPFGNARAEMESANAAPDDEKLQDSVWPSMPDKTAAEAPQAGAQDGTVAPLQAAQSDVAQDAPSQQAPSTGTNWPTSQSATTPAPDLKPTLNGSDTALAATIQPVATPVAAASPPQPEAATAPASDSTIGSIPTLLAALACALGLAAILGSIAMKIFDRRREVKVQVVDRVRRRDIWSGIPAETMPQPYPAMSTPRNLDDIAAAPEGDDSDQEIAHLLAKASRRRAA